MLRAAATREGRRTAECFVAAIARGLSGSSAPRAPDASRPAPAAAAGPAASGRPAPRGAEQAFEKFREKVASGPDFMDFVHGTALDYSVPAPATIKEAKTQRKPDWMKRAPIPGGDKYTEIKSKLRELKLATVCEEAKCPNIGECWGGDENGHGATATIMLMGDTCTRGCRFCAVKTSAKPPPVDPNEPEHVASAIAAWGLDYVVLTSVNRDDLPDQGSAHIAATVRGLKAKAPNLLVEALVPDFRGDGACVAVVAGAGLDVYAHNVETVERLQGVVRDHRAGWKQSLSTLEAAKRAGAPVTKTSIMLGVGEEPQDVHDALRQLRGAGVDVVTFGQYMRPTKKHMAVSAFITPEAFDGWRQVADSMGFRYVAAGPMVRSSYRAGELYLKNMLQKDRAAATGAAAVPGAGGD